MTGSFKLSYRQCGGVELRQKNGEETPKKIETLRWVLGPDKKH
jgi:hypothetical protein